MTTTEKLETFASQLEGVFTNEIESNVFDEEVTTDVDAELDQPIARARLNFQKVIPFDPDIHPDRISFDEVTDIFGKVNTKKACGPDHITNNLIPTIHIILQDLLNICVFHGYHPRPWKRTLALMAMAKRRSDPCSYRPISLLCCLSKVFEATMTKRLMSWAKNTDKLPTELLTSSLSLPKPFVRLNDCLGAWAQYFKIKKRHSTVWHNGLRHELLHMNAPALLIRWISSFLRNRTVMVRILCRTSREIAINYGVPQGNTISPLLFLPYMSKLPKLLPNTRRSLFADDFMIYTESSITGSHLIQSNLQTSMDALALYNSDHRIILSCTKSVRVLFERRKNNRLKPQDVTYNGQVIPSSSSVKFLGITFDSALTIFSTTYGPSTSTLIRAPATCVASPAIRRTWERIQTHFISRALSIPSIHPQRQKTAARIPSTHPRKKPVPSQTLVQASDAT